MDIDIDKQQQLENKFANQRDFLNKQEQVDLRRMTLGENLDRFNPEGDSKTDSLNPNQRTFREPNSSIKIPNFLIYDFSLKP